MFYFFLGKFWPQKCTCFARQFSILVSSKKEAESGKMVLVSCIIDFKDKQV
jgi:hypothetical protein